MKPTIDFEVLYLGYTTLNLPFKVVVTCRSPLPPDGDISVLRGTEGTLFDTPCIGPTLSAKCCQIYQIFTLL